MRKRLIAGSIVVAAIVTTVTFGMATAAVAQAPLTQFSGLTMDTPQCASEANRLEVSGVYVGEGEITLALELYNANNDTWSVPSDDGLAASVNGEFVDGYTQAAGHVTVQYGDRFAISHSRGGEHVGYGDGSAGTYRLSAMHTDGVTLLDHTVVLNVRPSLFPSYPMCVEFGQV